MDTRQSGIVPPGAGLTVSLPAERGIRARSKYRCRDASMRRRRDGASAAVMTEVRRRSSGTDHQRRDEPAQGRPRHWARRTGRCADFSRLGTFSIRSWNRTVSASSRISWVLRVTPGSAQISSRVRSGPTPASPSAAATFTLAGNPRAAVARAAVEDLQRLPRALPRRCRARRDTVRPRDPPGGLRVIMVTDSMPLSAAPRTASSPITAPLGTTICAPVARAASTRSAWSSSAPALMATSTFPARTTGSAISRNTAAGALSTTMSARSASSPATTTSTGVRKPRHPLSRPRVVARRHRREGQAVDLAAVDAPGDLEADGAETADANAVRTGGWETISMSLHGLE